LAWAAILFLTYLTLLGWDIGAGGAASEEAAVYKSARICAGWTLGAGAFIAAIRYWRFGSRWFVLTGAALLHVALHGLVGISYLLAGAISFALAAIAIALSYFTGSSAGVEDSA
jgi:hypothetical protein